MSCGSVAQVNENIWEIFAPWMGRLWKWFLSFLKRRVWLASVQNFNFHDKHRLHGHHHLHKQPLDQVLGGHLHVPRPLQLAGEDLLVDPERVVVVERGVAWSNTCQHLLLFIETSIPLLVCLVYLSKQKNSGNDVVLRNWVPRICPHCPPYCPLCPPYCPPANIS